jgi:MFS family permease
MFRSKSFVYITLADLIARSAYQMGKTPLLPLYAAALGAGDALLGFIVSVSTLTGMLLKPFVGFLSDRWGRRGWLIVGTVFFAVMPFMYRFVQTPEQLFAVRMIHGLATAIYGPVTLAYVAEQSSTGRAERLAWFGTARNAGYIVGPAAAGWMLLSMDPVSVFTVVGWMSCVVFIPVLLLPESKTGSSKKRPPILKDAAASLWSGGRTGAVWLAGGMEAGTFMALYATKTFLPIYALAAGFNVAVVGTFFAVQEAAHIIVNPIGGRVGDRFGYYFAIPIGMAAIAISLPLLPIANNIASLMSVAIVMGVAQAFVFPSTIAMVSAQIKKGNVATGMGLVGTMKNIGKVSGPVIAGGLIHWLDYTITFRLFGVAMLLGALFVWQRSRTTTGGSIDVDETSLRLERGASNSSAD